MIRLIQKSLGFAALGLCLIAPPALADKYQLDLGQGVNFSWYGWLHFAQQGFDDGATTTTNFVDITSATSRFGFYLRGESPLSFHFETGLGFRPSTKTSQVNTPEFWDWSVEDLRKVQLVHDSQFGVIRLGQGSMSMDGGAEADLGGTVILSKSTIPEAWGSYLFRDTNGTLTNITIGQTFDNFDNGRRFRLRYDTPSFAGFSLSASYGKEVLKKGNDDRFHDFALRYSHKFDRIEVKAAAGSAVVNFSTGGNERESAGSVSVLDHATGLNLTMALGRNHGSGAEYVWTKAGWNTDLVAIGQTKFILEGFLGNDYVSRGSDSRMWGVGLIQEFDRQRIEAYVGYKRFSFQDRSPSSYNDAGAWQIGARWKF